MDSPSVIACIQSLDVRRECTQINSRHHEIERYTSSTDASAEAASSKSSLFGLCTQTWAMNKVNAVEAFSSVKFLPTPIQIVRDDESAE